MTSTLKKAPFDFNSCGFETAWVSTYSTSTYVVTVEFQMTYGIFCLGVENRVLGVPIPRLSTLFSNIQDSTTSMFGETCQAEAHAVFEFRSRQPRTKLKKRSFLLFKVPVGLHTAFSLGQNSGE
jgi:hypothetical protein